MEAQKRLFSANEVIEEIFNNYAEKRKIIEFKKELTVAKDHDEFECRTYIQKLVFNEAVMLGKYVLTIGRSSSVRMDEIGNFLLLIPVKKRVNTVDNIEVLSIFNTILVSYNNNLFMPEIQYIASVVKPMKSSTHEIPNKMELYKSTISDYDQEFLQDIMAAIEKMVGFNNSKTKSFDEKYQAIAQTTAELDALGIIYEKAKSLLGEIKRLDNPGDYDYDGLTKSLDSFIAYFESTTP